MSTNMCWLCVVVVVLLLLCCCWLCVGCVLVVCWLCVGCVLLLCVVVVLLLCVVVVLLLLCFGCVLVVFWFAVRLAVRLTRPPFTLHTGPIKKAACPCSWDAVKIHLTKCNWKSCGPSCEAPESKIMEIQRLRQNEDMISDYQVLANVGGKELWMQLETMTGTTHVMSAACFTVGCQETPLFGGLFIPFVPPAFVKNDFLKAGLTQMGAVFGFLGHR